MVLTQLTPLSELFIRKPTFEVNEHAVLKHFNRYADEAMDLVYAARNGPIPFVRESTGVRTYPGSFDVLAQPRLNALVATALVCVYAYEKAVEVGQPYCTLTSDALNASVRHLVRGCNVEYVDGFGTFSILTQDSFESKALIATLSSYFKLNSTPCSLRQRGILVNGFTIFGSDVPTLDADEISSAQKMSSL